MNFYPFHPGDYMLRTAHLSITEDAAYRRLLDLYYLNEAPISGTVQAIARVIRMRDEQESVAVVLEEFFQATDEGFRHHHCDQVIEQYKAKAKQASENGKRGGRPRKQADSEYEPENNPEETQPFPSANPEETGSKANQEPITNNQEDQEQKALVPSGDDTSAYSVEFEAFWAEYPKREGGNSKKGAFKAWKARLRSGVKAEEMILSARRYAAQMAARGSAGTSFVKQAATFLGPDDHWREALNSNVHPLKPGKGEMKPGDFEFYDCVSGKTRICNDATHDRETGYTWAYLKTRGQA